MFQCSDIFFFYWEQHVCLCSFTQREKRFIQYCVFFLGKTEENQRLKRKTTQNVH